MKSRSFWFILSGVLLLHLAFFWWVSDKPVQIREIIPMPKPTFKMAEAVFDVPRDPDGAKLRVREFTVSTRLAEEEISPKLPPE